MKLAKSTTQVQQNFKAQASYDMKLSEGASAHIIQSLINLYSDPAAAVIRELSSNARDAHVQAGKADVPIKVITPNRFGNNELIFVDEGIGLDETGLETYVTLGESTKGEDNDQIGAYGLGCKSPLSLTSQFTVVAVKDGIKRHAVIGEMATGKLGMEIISVRETNEPNGVTVRVPVRDQDVTSIQSKAQDFFKYWSPGTVLLDGAQPRNFLDDLNENQYVETTNATVYTTGGSSYDNRLTVTMGNVAYPVDINQIATKLEEKDDSGAVHGSLSSLGLSFRTQMVLEAPIGKLELVPSRDALKYSSMTIDTLADLIIEARDETLEILTNRVKAASSYAEAEILINKADQIINLDSEKVTDFKTHNGHEYDTKLVGVPKDGLEGALEDLRASDEYEDGTYYSQRMMEGELRSEYLNTWKVAEADLRGNTMSFRPMHSSRSTTESLNSFVPANSTVGIRFNHDTLVGKKDDRVIIHFDISGDELEDFRMTSQRVKVKEWLNEKDYSSVFVIAGPVKYNPWIHENDNVTIVDGADFLAEVTAIREERKRQNKANNGPTVRQPRTETKYEYQDGSTNGSIELPIADMSADTLVYQDQELGYNTSLSKLLVQEGVALVGVTRNRSVDAFIRRAEDAGKTVKKAEDWVTEVVQKIASNEAVFEDSVTKKMRDKILGHQVVFRLSMGFYDEDFKKAHENTKVGKLTLTEIRDICEEDQEGLDNETDQALAEALTARIFFSHEGLTDFWEKAKEKADEKVGLAGIEEDYPMLGMISVYNMDRNVVCDYIKLVNDSKK